MRRFLGIRGAATVLTTVGLLAACATPQSDTYDLRPALSAAAPAAQVQYLDCKTVSEKVCDCRRGGLKDQMEEPSRAHLDLGYQALAGAIEDGADTREIAEARALEVMFAQIKTDVEDICSYFE